MSELWNKAAEAVAAFGLWVVWYLAPIHQTMAAVFVFVIADFVTGLWASLKRGEKFQSRRLRETLGKAIAYQLALVVSLVFEPFAGGVPVVKVVSGFIAWTEFQSFVENISSITGKDLWAAVRAKLQPAAANQSTAAQPTTPQPKDQGPKQ